ADVKAVMSGAGSALMGIGNARGDGRAAVAGARGLGSPPLGASMDGAHGVLLNISGGSDLGLFEVNAAAQLVADAAHPEANIIFGAVIDDALGDEVRVTVIAAGFDAGAPTPVRRIETRRPAAVEEPAPAPKAASPSFTPTARPRPTSPPPAPRRTVVFEDDLDVPDFLK
ncbi:MAG: cell division protein FtsZ, partial [Frankiales bacterium]|nr:cell division protein FtsZ [Frankiales bacterium]